MAKYVSKSRGCLAWLHGARSKNKLKKAALNIIAGQMSESEIAEPRPSQDMCR